MCYCVYEMTLVFGVKSSCVSIRVFDYVIERKPIRCELFMQKVIFSVEPVRYPLTGIGRYALELSKELPRVCEKGRLLFFDGYHISNEFVYNETEISVFSPCISRLKSLVKKSASISKFYFNLQRYRETKALEKYESCMVHGTNFVCPKFNGKKIVSFHDMSAYLAPHCQDKARLKILREECEKTVKSADALITISEASKHSIINYFNYSADRIFVTPLACNQDFYFHDDIVTSNRIQRLGLTPKKYTLFVGTIEPRKNVLTLIAAYKRLPKSLRDHVPLVICGHKGWKSEETFVEIDKGESEGWLHYLNYVDQFTLQSLYAGAKLFCFPSLYEGFGLPLLEAMAAKVPVISADNSSLPEVVGKAGILIPAKDVDCWTEKIYEVLESTILASDLANKGYKRSKLFSWERCAMETVKAYNAVEQF